MHPEDDAVKGEEGNRSTRLGCSFSSLQLSSSFSSACEISCAEMQDSQNSASLVGSSVQLSPDNKEDKNL